MEKTKCRITLILDLEGHNDLLNIMNVKTERTILYFVMGLAIWSHPGDWVAPISELFGATFGSK